jgi:hypothetical protein
MLTVDLKGAWEAKDDYLAFLEQDLQQLISERKLALTCEKPKIRWVVHQPSTHHASCRYGGLCQDCPHRSGNPAQAHQKASKASGSKRG